MQNTMTVQTLTCYLGQRRNKILASLTIAIQSPITKQAGFLSALTHFHNASQSFSWFQNNHVALV